MYSILTPWQTRADAVCINKKQMLLATPAVLFPCSIPGRNQLKNISVLSLKLSLCSLQSHFDKLTPQISSPMLSFARIILFFFLKHVLILFAQLEAFGIRSWIHFARSPRN